MKPADAYEDAVDLLDADHKAVKKLFIDFNALCDDGAAPSEKQPVADKICQALLVHAQIEEEIFYPAVRKATGDAPLVEEAIDEHAQAKETIAKIQGMDASDKDFDRRSSCWASSSTPMSSRSASRCSSKRACRTPTCADSPSSCSIASNNSSPPARPAANRRR